MREPSAWSDWQFNGASFDRTGHRKRIKSSAITDAKGQPIEYEVANPHVHGTYHYGSSASFSAYFSRADLPEWRALTLSAAPTPQEAVVDPQGRPLRSERVVQIPERRFTQARGAVSGQKGGHGTGVAVSNKK